MKEIIYLMIYMYLNMIKKRKWYMMMKKLSMIDKKNDIITINKN